MENKYYVAFDLGATSGRTILGTLTPEGKLTTEEVTRFPNQMLDIDGHLHWNIFSLYDHIIEGLRKVAAMKIKPESIGIDTWGVDVVCINPDGKISAIPYAYRDSTTFGSPARFFESVMTAEELYGRTGIQTLEFNTVFQLNEHKNEHAFTTADTILFIPDALNFMLTGVKATEYTIASTGQILNPHGRDIDFELIEKIGISRDKFSPVVEPGTVIGRLRKSIAETTGIGEVPVVAIAGHDTASAVAAIPARNKNFAYLSSGTWSLMGIETEAPVVNEMTLRENITNEGGVFGTIRLLKNITGMWIVEQCLKSWKKQGVSYSYPEMVKLAEEAPAFRSMIDPDDSSFVSPADMPTAIEEYCRKTGQPVPETHGQFIRTVFESLALKYRFILDIFKKAAEHPIEVLHVIGGGSRNAFLNQLTSNAIGLPVVAGPAEASAIGNIMMQTGSKSLQELRDIVRDNIETVTYTPADAEIWDEAYGRYRATVL